MVIGALQSRLMDPALLAEFCAEYTRHLNALRGAQNAALDGARAELGKLARQREHLIQAIKDGVPAAEVKDDLARIAARREELEALLEGKRGPAGAAAPEHGRLLPRARWRRWPTPSMPTRTGPRRRTSSARLSTASS